MLPDLARLPGVETIYAGRQGPDDTGERLVASIWESEERMIEAVGATFDRPPFHPEHLDDTEDRRLAYGRVWFGLDPRDAREPHVIRLVFGQVRPGRLAEYLARARTGTREDLDAGRAPLALYICDTGPDRFATLSIWGQWTKVAEATGGSIGEPATTRHAELLESWQVEHYESIATDPIHAPEPRRYPVVPDTRPPVDLPADAGPGGDPTGPIMTDPAAS